MRRLLTLILLCVSFFVTANEAIVFGIVDPYSSGEDLVAYLQSKGYETVQIDSDTIYGEANPEETKANEICNHHVHYSPDLAKTVDILKKLHVTYILPGCEDGVLYADKLCFYLDLPFNGLEKSDARRNKFLMHQEVAKAGVKIPKQVVCKTKEEALLSIENYPVVTKPLNSCSSDGVFICTSEDEYHQAIDYLLSHKTVFNQEIKEFIVQEYVDGTEYIVNSVSYNGEHFITDMWMVKKGDYNGSKVVYEGSQLLTSDHEVAKLLKDYSSSVLDALDYKIGASHMEVKINSKGEPRLIEVGARLSGGLLHKLVRKAAINGKSQLEYLIDAYLTPANLEELKNGYAVNKSAFSAQLISHLQGTVKEIRVLDKLETLPSFCTLKLTVQKGDFLPLTVNLSTCPGHVLLVHENPAQLLADYTTLRQTEKEMFLLEPENF